jgi:hypothetical protein
MKRKASRVTGRLTVIVIDESLMNFYQLHYLFLIALDNFG